MKFTYDQTSLRFSALCRAFFVNKDKWFNFKLYFRVRFSSCKLSHLIRILFKVQVSLGTSQIRHALTSDLHLLLLKMWNFSKMSFPDQWKNTKYRSEYCRPFCLSYATQWSCYVISALFKNFQNYKILV